MKQNKKHFKLKHIENKQQKDEKIRKGDTKTT